MHRLDQIRAQISAPILIHPHVKSALLENKPVVALESTILAHGMPFPQNLETARQVEQIVRDNGAIPATIAVMNGILKIGLSDQELEIIARKGNQCRKVSRRDLAAVLASREFGATTVSGTMIAAEMSGIDVFVTGGIGGVHRGAEVSMDISADLLELGKTSVAVVCAGVKSILDIPKTLEVLETQGTAVAVLNSEEFPAFFTRKSGSPAPMVVQSEKECAGIILNSKKLGLKSGMVFAVPIPDESDGEFIEKATQLAIQEAERNKIIGKDITPFLLKRISELTKGNSLKLNIKLIKNNAKVGAQIAKELCKLRRSKVLIIGGSTVDTIVNPSALIPGTSNPGSIKQSYGGVGRNIAECLARLECSPHFISAVGDDSSGTELKKYAMQIGIQVDGNILNSKSHSTSNYLAVVDPKSHDLAYGFSDMSALQELDFRFIEGRVRHIGAQYLRIIILDGNLTSQMISEVCNLANSSRIETWYEPISVSKSTKCIAALKSGHLTYASPNYSELIELYHHLTGTNKKNASAEHSIHDISKFTQTLIQFGLKNCIAKIGKRGVVIAERSGNIEHIQAVNVPFEKIINMNGAGDTLVGSCVFGLLRGDNLIESAKRAVFASSLTIQSPFAISPEISPSTLLAL